jgi:hypothetical protein
MALSHHPGGSVMWSAEDEDFFDDLDLEVDEMVPIEFA